MGSRRPPDTLGAGTDNNNAHTGASKACSAFTCPRTKGLSYIGLQDYVAAPDPHWGRAVLLTYVKYGITPDQWS